MIFESREEAGQQLARALSRYRNSGDAVVLALPRGGVVAGAQVARELNLPLGLVLVKKIGHPDAPEYAIGAIAETDEALYNEAEKTNIDHKWLGRAEASARDAIDKRRTMYYSEDLIPPSVEGKTVIVVDDGMATGLTMKAAVRSLIAREARKVIVAVPVASAESIDFVEEAADEIIVLDSPDNFLDAVGAHYRYFHQVDDPDVKSLLRELSAAGI